MPDTPTPGKHDGSCLERRAWGAQMRFVCTCALTDRQVREAWPRFRAKVNATPEPPAGDWKMNEEVA